VPKTPFREEAGRHDVEIFIRVSNSPVRSTRKYGFRLSVHRPAYGDRLCTRNAMNMGVTLAIFSTIARHPRVRSGFLVRAHGIVFDGCDACRMARAPIFFGRHK